MEREINRLKRRRFLQHTACVVCCAPFASFFSSCENPEEVTEENNIPLTEGEPIIFISAESALQSVGGAVKKRFSLFNDTHAVIIIRTANTSFTAFDARCTHQGTIVELPNNGVMICLNHGSKFSTTNGNVIQGPATAPLKKFTATFDSEKNSVTLH